MSYDPQNIFAKILRGEASSIKVHEDEHTLTIMDVMPQADGHVLVLTKELADEIFALSEAGAAACMLTARKAAIAVKVAFDADGVLVAQYNGHAAGQTVPHVHMHVVPRTDGQPLRRHALSPENPNKLRALAKKIIAAWPA
ncbi:MAG: HIT family protein [Candidimonas sp.]|nr:MAG: HIT family protein [Candidimonas sp.]